MGLFFTLLYILTAYLTPATIMGSLAVYHVEIVVAIFTMIATLFNSSKPAIHRMPQTYALMGLAFASFLSVAASGWIGGAPVAVLKFLPNLLTFFFVVMNCRTRAHLQMVVATLLFVCVFVICRGYADLASGELTSPFLMVQGTEGEDLYRLRGLGFINDPNDFAQILVSLVPCLFLFWRPKRAFFNIVRVLIPVAFLIFGMFLTHSRGAMIALLVVIIVAARRKIGTVPSVVIAVVLFVAAMAAGWSGGRDVSAEAGADRMEAWSTGLQLIKSHPIFGVGYMSFGDYYEITAHNSIVVCAAELGVVGFFFWVMFIVCTLREALEIGNPTSETEAVDEASLAPAYLGRVSVRARPIQAVQRSVAFAATGTPAIAGPAGLAGPADSLAVYARERSPEEIRYEEIEAIRRVARIMILSMTGFLVAGWFLSRAYQMSIFLYGGMIEVIYQLALKQGVAPVRMPIGRLLRVTLLVVFALLALVYIILRADHLIPH
jgi:O-antigen ligase